MNVMHECLKCGEEIPVDYDTAPKTVECPACKAQFAVDYDADYDNGWKDRTHLYVKEP